MKPLWTRDEAWSIIQTWQSRTDAATCQIDTYEYFLKGLKSINNEKAIK